jgi:hypothetical protein
VKRGMAKVLMTLRTVSGDTLGVDDATKS